MEAGELFDICCRLASSGPSPQSRRQLHEILSLTAAKGCSGVRGNFGNLFSQTDFLCRRLGISPVEQREIQTARHNCHAAPTPGLSDDWLYDVRAVVLFVSAVFAVGAPAALRRVLPPLPRQHERGLKINKRYVRCIVRSFDESIVWADTGDGEIAVDYGNTGQGRDLSYLRKILRPGMQLNLLDCNVSSTASNISPLVTPTIIIVEPDFLIDISSLSACFTSYGHHPLLYTLNRLKPRPNTRATLLGNFAGVALDMSIHASESVARSSQEALDSAIDRAYREDPLRYLACPDMDPMTFRNEAEQQMTNIAGAVDILQEEACGHGGFLLEPSFVCEQLGLQGRVDLMTTDMSLLVEQKAGRNMKIELTSHDSHGLQLESQYVQLLLYYATLRYNFQRGDRDVDTRLLYSRYEASRGLLAVNYYRSLLREALKLRNQIVATELLIARDGFQRILPLLTSEVIYKDVARDGYFHRYVQPTLTALNASLSALSSLERCYFERMMTFVYREQVASRLGSSEQRLHHSGGAASDLWLMPLEEKVETGNIHVGLAIAGTQRSDPDGGYDIISLRCEPFTVSCSNFRRGDMVYLYQYDGVPDVRRAILYKGTLADIADDSLTVCLTDGQQNVEVFNNDRPWAVEHGSSDASTSGNIRSLFQFATADAHRRALLLGQREPLADTSLRLFRSYNAHYDDILLRIRQARDYFLLVGPPGTGKTSMALRYMVDEELTHHSTLNSHHSSLNSQLSTLNTHHSSLITSHSSLLLTAYTNRAVDEICAMLDDAGHDYLRIGNATSCDPRLHSLSIVVATTSMLLSRPYIFDICHFSLCIVDEASQILEPGLVGILASDRVDRFVLVGDHKQLPAVVQQGGDDALVTEPQLRAIGLTDCRHSLFQRLYQWELAQGRTRFIGTLTHQGRMHPDVASFANSHFYDGRLLPVPVTHQRATSLDYDLPAEDRLDELLKERRVLFIPTHTPHPSPFTPHPSPFTTLEEEARLVADLLRRIYRFYGERFDADKTVGVIVPYRSQIAAIMAETARLGIDVLNKISVDTVERYQGSQRDVIIYSFAVSHVYQLDFLAASTYTDSEGNAIDRKLNVALTRARCQTVMVGNAEILRHNVLFAELIREYSV